MCRRTVELVVFALYCFFSFPTIADGAYSDVADQVVEWSDRRSCTKHEYFDTELFKCTKCASGLISSSNGNVNLFAMRSLMMWTRRSTVLFCNAIHVSYLCIFFFQVSIAFATKTVESSVLKRTIRYAKDARRERLLPATDITVYRARSVESVAVWETK